MRTVKLFGCAILAVVLILCGASNARAQAKAEVGASLMGASFLLGDDELNMFAAGSGIFGTLNPGIYASFFLGNHVGLEPQVSFVAAFSEGDSFHALNLAGQVDYFFSGIARRSPYVFGSVGLLEVSDADYSPKVFGVGAGYRIPVGDRLVFRFDGRYAHYTGEFEGSDSNALIFTLTIGGLFGG